MALWGSSGPLQIPTPFWVKLAVEGGKGAWQGAVWPRARTECAGSEQASLAQGFWASPHG